MESDSPLTAADVYETASEIGKDIEQIIENFGHNVVMDIMPKIIKVLEQLEVSVGEQEKSCLEMEEMRLQNERLLTEVKKEAGFRRRLDEELFQYKQTSTREITDLNNILEKLKDENQALQAEGKAHHLEKKEEARQLSSADLAVLEQMKSTIDNQRDAIRCKNSEIESIREDLEAMEEQVERLANINETIRRNLAFQKSRNAILVQEKSDFEADIKALRQRLSKPNCNVITVSENTRTQSVDMTKQEDKTRNRNTETDGKDPNRPRFTLKELQQVLMERNQLKEKVITLEEDLAFYKKCSEDEVDSASLEIQTSQLHQPKRKQEHETQKSGISKLFKFLWKEEMKTPVKPGEPIVLNKTKA